MITSLLDEAASGLNPNGAIDLVLGSRWSHAELVRLEGKKVAPEELDRLAEAFAGAPPNQSAETAAPWLSRAAPTRDHLLIATIPLAIRDRIVEFLATHDIRIRSIQPLWSWLTLYPDTRFRLEDGWTLLREPGVVSIAHLSAGELDSLRTYQTDDGAKVDQLLLRQAAATGLNVDAADAIEVIDIGRGLPDLPAGLVNRSRLRKFPN